MLTSYRFIIITIFSIIYGLTCSSIPCPVGWIRHNTSCYYASQNTLTWFDARAFCQALGSNLVVLNDQNEFEFVIKLAATPNKWYWVGLNDFNQLFDFVWEDGRRLDQNNLWFPKGQPFQAFKEGNNGCVNTDGVNKVLNNWRCMDPSNYICEIKLK